MTITVKQSLCYVTTLSVSLPPFNSQLSQHLQIFVYAFFIERFCQCCQLCGNIFFELVIIVKLFDLGGSISVAKVDGSHQGQSCRCTGDVQTGLKQFKKSCHITFYVYSFNLTSGGVVNICCNFKLASQSGNHIKRSLIVKLLSSTSCCFSATFNSLRLANKFVDTLPQSMKRREGK